MIPRINIDVLVNCSLEKVWEYWTLPQHIINWNFAADTWHSPNAKNDLKVGGKFCYRMEAKDGSSGFDFSGVYTSIDLHKTIKYIMDDGRKASLTFLSIGNDTEIIEIFEAETENTIELQEQGWQMILNNFKKYSEQNS